MSQSSAQMRDKNDEFINKTKQKTQDALYTMRAYKEELQAMSMEPWGRSGANERRSRGTQNKI